jgi:pimeloyl-ACP methyl ester carboxylesterase
VQQLGDPVAFGNDVMTKPSRVFSPTDMVGFGRLATDAVAGLTDVVEAVHAHIACESRGRGPTLAEVSTSGITELVYGSIRAVNRLVNQSFSRLEPLIPPPVETGFSPKREAMLAALNGVVGDYLARTRNPLAISMSIRRNGRPLQLKRNVLRRTLPEGTGKVLLLVHGLCLSDLHWKRNAHDHGEALAMELGYTPVYLNYNTGLHVSENGRLLAGLLETLVKQWPVPIQKLAILSHSMGGLVVRSAHYYGNAAGHDWPMQLRRIIFLGTPHHGATLERLGNWVNSVLAVSPYAAPIARVGKIRSAGITDLRHGTVLEDDWKGRDRFTSNRDLRTPLPLPAGVQCYAIAASKRQDVGGSGADLLGDGFVSVNSALGRHADPEKCLAFGDSHQWTGHGMSHWDLFSHPAVYEQIRRWSVVRP